MKTTREQVEELVERWYWNHPRHRTGERLVEHILTFVIERDEERDGKQ